MNSIASKVHDLSYQLAHLTGLPAHTWCDTLCQSMHPKPMQVPPHDWGTYLIFADGSQLQYDESGIEFYDPS